MKDIPYPDREIRQPPEGRMSIAYGMFKMSPEVQLNFRVSTYYDIKDDKRIFDKNVRIWEFHHKCDDKMYPPIYNDKCTGCNRKFPFQNIITSIRLHIFKSSPNLEIKYAYTNPQECPPV
jgi:hypothetical protein